MDIDLWQKCQVVQKSGLWTQVKYAFVATKK